MAGGTDFFLQIEAEMRGAAGAVGELQELAEGLAAAKSKYADFERASVGTGKALEAVGGKIATLRERMAKASAAGDSKAFWGDAGKLNALVAQEEKLKVKADGAKKALEGQGQALTKLAAQYGKLKTAEQEEAKAAKAANDNRDRIEKSAGGLKKLGGPLGRLGDVVEDTSEAWHALKANLGTTGAVTALAAVGIAMVAAALVAGAVAAGKWALGMANTSRNTGLTLQAMAGSAEAGAALKDALSETTHETGIASDRLIDLTRDLQKAKVSADDLPAALLALAQQEQALGDSSGTAALIEDLKSGKKSVGALADEMDSKFGGIVKKKMMGLDQLTVRFGQHLDDLFTGEDSEEFFGGAQRLMTALVTGAQTAKVVLQSMFSGVDWESSFIAVGRFFLGMVIGAQQVYIAVLKVSRALGLDDIGKGWKDFPSAATLGSVAAYALLGPILMIAGAAAIAVKNLEMLVKGATALKDIGVGLSGAKVETRMSKPTDQTAQFTQSGANAGKGWAAGLDAQKVGAMVAATGFGAAVHGAYKLAAGERSPAKLWMASGAYAAEGYTMGLESGVPAANDAAASLGTPPTTTITASGTPASPPQVRIENHFHITQSAGEDSEAFAQRVAAIVLDVAEGAALQLGASSGVAA